MLFPQELELKQDEDIYSQPFHQHAIEVLASTIKKKKKKKSSNRPPNGKVKQSLFTNDINHLLAYSLEATEKLLQVVNEFSKIACIK